MKISGFNVKADISISYKIEISTFEIEISVFHLRIKTLFKDQMTKF